ncbi:MAG TPA: hypothetical protein VFV08_04820, partial [Puia sp.]|nr:hypothetical protein [Puia sp.]
MNTIHRGIKHTSLLSAFIFISSMAFSQVIPDSLVRNKIREIHNPLQRLLVLEPQIYQYNTEQWKDIRLPKGYQYGF